MFRPNCPSSGVQVVMKRYAALLHCSAFIYIYIYIYIYMSLVIFRLVIVLLLCACSVYDFVDFCLFGCVAALIFFS
jgi:hypothetical protein